MHTTSCHFGVDRKRIREWGKKHKSLLGNFGTAMLQQNLSNQVPVFTEVDDDFFEFLNKKRRAECNRLVSKEVVKVAHSLQLGNFVVLSQYISGENSSLALPWAMPLKKARRHQKISRRPFTPSGMPSVQATSTPCSILK